MTRTIRWIRRAGLAVVAAALLLAGLVPAARAETPKTLTLDWAYYNPVSLVLKDKGWMEQEFAKDGITIRWVQSLGSNKAIEFLNAGSIQFGSTAGAAALLAKINGSPIKSVYVYSKPEWTALVVAKGSPIQSVADLRGKRVAVTRGTDPYIFLLRALQKFGLTEKDIKPVLLQHQDGRTALEKGDVDAWAGLDPMMAQTELEQGSRLFYRNADANTYGFLNTPEAFAAENPKIVSRVIAVYERARKYSLANPAELKHTLAAAAKLSDAVAERQLERTDLKNPVIGPVQRESITAAGIALQQAGVIDAQVNVAQAVAALIEPKFGAEIAKTVAARD
jgi:sulfonate transport system substrate-binding protein